MSRAEPGWKGGSWTTTRQGDGSTLTVFLDGKPLHLAPGEPDGSGWRTWVDRRWSSTAHHLDLYAHDFGLDWNPPVDEFALGSQFKVLLLVIVPQYVARMPMGGAETSLTTAG